MTLSVCGVWSKTKSSRLVSEYGTLSIMRAATLIALHAVVIKTDPLLSMR
jgi:hypothetical protein